MKISSRAFRALAQRELENRPRSTSWRVNSRRFRAKMGCSSLVCSNIWNRLTKKGILPPEFRAHHLLWTLVFLKLCCCETITADICGCDEKTLRKWVWIGIDLLGQLDLVSVVHDEKENIGRSTHFYS